MPHELARTTREFWKAVENLGDTDRIALARSIKQGTEGGLWRISAQQICGRHVSLECRPTFETTFECEGPLHVPQDGRGRSTRIDSPQAGDRGGGASAKRFEPRFAAFLRLSRELINTFLPFPRAQSRVPRATRGLPDVR
jgi:hypothetical protein